MAFVDFQNDVKDKDIGLAAKEGFRWSNIFKRYTTLAWRRIRANCPIFPASHLGQKLGKSIPNRREIFSVRRGPRWLWAPCVIIAAAISAGEDHADPCAGRGIGRGVCRGGAVGARRLIFRARAKPIGRSHSTVRCGAVRSGVGLIDVSTFGKIDLQGPMSGRCSTASISTCFRVSRREKRAMA